MSTEIEWNFQWFLFILNENVQQIILTILEHLKMENNDFWTPFLFGFVSFQFGHLIEYFAFDSCRRTFLDSSIHFDNDWRHCISHHNSLLLWHIQRKFPNDSDCKWLFFYLWNKLIPSRMSTSWTWKSFGFCLIEKNYK